MPLGCLQGGPNDKGGAEEEQKEVQMPRTSIMQRYRQQYNGEKLFLTAGAKRFHGLSLFVFLTLQPRVE